MPTDCAFGVRVPEACAWEYARLTSISAKPPLLLASDRLTARSG